MGRTGFLLNKNPDPCRDQSQPIELPLFSFGSWTTTTIPTTTPGTLGMLGYKRRGCPSLDSKHVVILSRFLKKARHEDPGYGWLGNNEVRREIKSTPVIILVGPIGW